MSFTDLQLAEPLLRAITEQGYLTPSPIQLQAIPAILQGHDLLASAQTGTGKTAGFALPILQRLSQLPKAKGNHALALILTPTRELAAQVHESFMQYGKYLDKMRSTVVFGGVKINPQMLKLRSGVEVLVATPGRLMDLYQQNAIKFEQINTLVLDEADRMLDMGFIHDIKRIIAKLPRDRQNLMFSATFSDEIRQLAKAMLNSPVEIDVAPRNAAAVKVDQTVHPVDKARKADLLSHLIRVNNWDQALVFSRTKHGANKLVKLLAQDKIESMAIHGNKSQAQRTKALSDFKSGKVKILIATDIAARGIDIDHLPRVVNFDLPQVAEDYVHRIGRTGRAGSSGQAISLVCADECKLLHDIERLIKRRIERVAIDDFEPVHDVPVSSNSHSARNQGGGRYAPKPQSASGNRRGNGRPSGSYAGQQQRRGQPGKSHNSSGSPT